MIILTFLLFFIPIASANEPLNVAVSYFANNSNNETLNNLEKGIAEMLITDLSISKDIRLVERERLNDVLKEIDLQKNPYFDSASAAQLGKGLGAGIIVTGSFMVMNDTMRIDARLIDVDSSEVLLAVESNGSQNEFFNVQAQLAKKILSGIGSELTILDQKKIGTNGTKDFGAFTAYSTGLNALDDGDKKGAQKAFEQAKSIDPSFALADEYLNQLGVKAKSTLERAKAAQNTKINQLVMLAESSAPLDCDVLWGQYSAVQAEHLIKYMDGANPEEARRYFGLLHQLITKLITEWNATLDANMNCGVTLTQLYSAYGGYVYPVVYAELEVQKAQSFGQESRHANLYKQSISGIRLESWDGQTLVTHDQIPSVYTQLLDQLLSIALESQNQFLQSGINNWAGQLEEISTYLQTDVDQTVIDDKQMAMLKSWILTESPVHLMQMGYSYMLSFTEEVSFSYTDENYNITTVTIGFEEPWVRNLIVKIEGKWIHQTTFSELPTATNTKQTTFCIPNISTDWAEGCTNICGKEDYGIPTPYAESKSPKCNVQLTEGWFVFKTTSEGYNTTVYADFTPLMAKYKQGIPQDPNQPLTLRFTFTDGSTEEIILYP